jgi:adenylyl cyclase-associated protein
MFSCCSATNTAALPVKEVNTPVVSTLPSKLPIAVVQCEKDIPKGKSSESLISKKSETVATKEATPKEEVDPVSLKEVTSSLTPTVAKKVDVIAEKGISKESPVVSTPVTVSKAVTKELSPTVTPKETPTVSPKHTPSVSPVTVPKVATPIEPSTPKETPTVSIPVTVPKAATLKETPTVSIPVTVPKAAALKETPTVSIPVTVPKAAALKETPTVSIPATVPKAAALKETPTVSIPVTVPKVATLKETPTVSIPVTVPKVASKEPSRTAIPKELPRSISLSQSDELSEEMSAEIMAVLQNIQQRLTNIESGMGQSNSGSSAAAAPVDESKLSQSVTAFDVYMTTFLDPFSAACTALGGDLTKGGDLVKEAFVEMRSFIALASACKEPPAAGLPALLTKVTEKTTAIKNAEQRNDWQKHMKTLSEGCLSLNWLIVKPAPCDFINSCAEGADYWANNIRKEFRTTNPKQIAFCDTFKALILELVKYVKEYHRMGLTWNPKGGDAATYSGSAPAKAAAPAAAAVVSPKAAAVVPKAAPQGADLFASLNKGGNITAGLKTVTKDQQTWRSEYKGPEGAAPVTPAAAVAARNAPSAASVVKGPPKLEFQNAGSKWLVENQSETSGVVEVNITEMKETVYIYGCVGATIDIKGKCKSIVVDGCKKTKVLFDTAMASCEVINCSRMQIQCRQKVAAVAIDKTDGIIVFLPATSLGKPVYQCVL